jgi:glycosyltransferase domain-containing protein
MNLDNLTIICPTYNRPYMLDRTLKYYSDNNFSCKILIADSSEIAAKNILMGILEKYSSILDIEYFHLPDNPDFAFKLFESANRVTSKYSIILPDDDLIIKSGLQAVISSLDKDSSISAAYGNRLSISAIAEPNESFEWIKCFPYYTVSIYHEKAIDRIRRLPVPSWWQFPYAVYRTEVLKASTNVIRDMKYTQFTEFFFYSAILSYGNWVKVDCLFALCNTDSEYYSLRDRDSFKHYWGAGSIMAQLFQPFWSEHILKLSKRVAEILDQDKTMVEENSAKLRNIYFSINNKYLDENGLSDHLYDENQYFSKKANKFRLNLLRFFWIFSLRDRNGGYEKWAQMFKGLFVEIFKGRFTKLLLLDFSFKGLKRLLVSLQRTGTLDYEIQLLLNNNSKFHSDFLKAFNAWVDNPCPKKYFPK